MSTRCNYIEDVTPLPDASTNYEEPFLRTRQYCRELAVVVRWQDGMVVEGYCQNHAEQKNLSLNPWPRSGWRRYSDAEFYGMEAH